MPLRFEDHLYLRLVVERRIIHDDEAIWSELWQKRLFYPCLDGMMRTTSLEQHGGKPLLPALRHDKINCFPVVSADFTKDLLAAFCPSVWAIAVLREAALIEVNDIGAAVPLYPMAQVTQKIHSFTVIYFSVARRFF